MRVDSVSVVTVVFLDLLTLMVTDNTDSTNDGAVLLRIKRKGGSGGSSYSGGGTLGTKVTISTGSSTTMSPLTMLLGAKALILKGILIKNLIDQKTSTQPPILTNVNDTAAGAVIASNPTGGRTRLPLPNKVRQQRIRQQSRQTRPGMRQPMRQH
jgi:hypothetical protein